MTGFSPSRRLAAEALGTALLLAVVVGSGIMAQRLAGGNDAIALLGNTVSTGAALVVLIWIFGPISGAHFNPAVTLVMAWKRVLSWRLAAAYATAQMIGAVLGVFVAHVMFETSVLQISAKARDGAGQAVAEVIASFGLLLTILMVGRFRHESTAIAVGLYITSAYWFTASTSFANPALTIARSLSDSFAGIAPHSVPMFIMAQFLGAGLALAACTWFFRSEPGTSMGDR